MGKGYGLMRFMIDLFLINVTGGIWLVWMLFKFIRS